MSSPSVRVGRASLLVAATFLVAACADSTTPADPSPLPNIVLIVPDDLGRHDVSFHGGEIATPNIDRIAAEGVRLERFYSAPVCSPTRAGLMTGRYPIRFGLMRAVIAPWRDYGMDTSEVTLPEVLAKAGYEHRGIFGKWHLGHFDRKHHPLRRGFTEFVGHNTAVDYFTKERVGERDWSHDYESVDEEGYVTDLLADHAVRFIDRHAGGESPFFLYVPFSAPHSPLQAKEEDLPRYADLEPLEPPRGWEESTAGRPLAADERRRNGRRVHAAMVHSLDEGVGRILDAIDGHGIADNTLVLFFSDNGGSVGIGDNGPYRGAKGSVFEGGTRVAAAARWPVGNIAGGGRIEAPMSYVDVLPTLMGIAGIDDHGGKPLDGVDVGDLLTGEAAAGPERDLYSLIAQLDPEREQVSVTEGEWKLVVVGPPLVREGAAEASRMMLFQLAEDPLEERDVAADHPDLVARLLEKAAAFRALQPPNPVAPFFAGREGFKPPPNWQFPSERPNILLVLIDDLGFEAIGAYGGASYKTPNIDQLAAEGVRFTHAYSTPLCSPSRLKLMTGRYNSRNYTEWGVLPRDELTFANLLRDAGYATFLAGKWQLSGFQLAWKEDCCEGRGRTPEEAGFDDYLVWHYHQKGERYANPQLWGSSDEGGIFEGGYGPDLFADFLLEKIGALVREDSDRPFFAYHSMALVHAPFVPTPDSADWNVDRKAEDPAYFADMVAYTDKLVGRMLDGLEELGVLDDTLILLTADNGTPRQITSTLLDGTVIPGGKGGTIDYGSHVPFIASWPAGIDSGWTSEALVDLSDFLPSMVEAAGAALPDDRTIDGRSFLPVLRGETDSARDSIFTDFRPRFLNVPEVTFVHDRRYKLYDDGRFFDFENDVREQSPLARDDLTEEAAAAMARLRAAMVEGLGG
ncbi:MAG: sulfatase-like hydrolase/transferase [Holophagales bacterium]|nr:sulfatase-like hydrolase/transferase [Holophagales bacterium]MYC08608.1 sulfatase-like hydrolase/transferase [Holophagales bacterium]